MNVDTAVTTSTLRNAVQQAYMLLLAKTINSQPITVEDCVLFIDTLNTLFTTIVCRAVSFRTASAEECFAFKLKRELPRDWWLLAGDYCDNGEVKFFIDVPIGIAAEITQQFIGE